jgi:hypothetical protein
MAGKDIKGMSKDELHRQILLLEALKVAEQDQAETTTVDPMVPRADDGTATVQPKRTPTPLRQQMSEEGRELAEQAATGVNLSGEGGIVDVPDEVQLYGYSDAQKAADPSLKDGPTITIPQAVQSALELIGDAGLTVAGTASQGAGYVIGGIADLFMKAGMSEGNAQKFARDMMAMPDAFMGSPSSLMRGRKVVNPSVGGVTEAQVAKRFTPDELAALRTADAPAPLAAAPTAPVAAAPTLTPEALGNLIRAASSGGRGSQQAAEALAAAAKVNPDAAAAARRLGIDVPADVLSDDTQLRSAAGLSRSIAGSEAEADFRNIVVAASKQADEMMATIDATPDVASIAERIQTALKQTQTSLQQAAKGLYNQVDAAVPASSLVEPQNSVMLLNKMLEELGGINALTGKEKMLFDTLTDPNTPLTYAALKKFRNGIGKAINKGEGEFADMDTGTAKRIYGALTEDYLATAQRVAEDLNPGTGSEVKATLRLANQTTAKQKALEKRIVTFFGKDGEGSLAGKLRTAITSGTKGDIAGLNRLLKIIPPELQREAVATAINALSVSEAVGFDGPFDFAKFSKTFEGLKRNKPVYNKVIGILGEDSSQFMADLNDISKRITQARGAVLQTGKANQALVQTLTAEGLIKSIFKSRVVRAGIGQAAGGPAGGAAIDTLGEIFLNSSSKEKISSAGNFLNSSTFQKLAVSASEPEIAAAIKTPAFKRLANALSINDGRAFLESALLASSTNEGSVGPAEAATPEAQAAFDSVSVPTMQIDPEGATAALIRAIQGQKAVSNKVQQAAQ